LVFLHNSFGDFSSSISIIIAKKELNKISRAPIAWDIYDLLSIEVPVIYVNLLFVIKVILVLPPTFVSKIHFQV